MQPRQVAVKLRHVIEDEPARKQEAQRESHERGRQAAARARFMKCIFSSFFLLVQQASNCFCSQLLSSNDK